MHPSEPCSPPLLHPTDTSPPQTDTSDARTFISTDIDAELFILLATPLPQCPFFFHDTTVTATIFSSSDAIEAETFFPSSDTSEAGPHFPSSDTTDTWTFFPLVTPRNVSMVCFKLFLR